MDPDHSSHSLDKTALNCKFCHRGFRRLEHLQRHTRIHTNEKPFSCPCGALFSRKDLLRRHERASHDDLKHPVQPPVSNNSLTSHLQDHSIFNYPSPESRQTGEYVSSLGSQRPVSQETCSRRSSIRCAINA
ncbi:hypothetical protein N7447_009530 [Penicillium robsamsonii]|uniref:uncharacterized protein n=1 Tax=Penicillium robsamsonii TaxID=1792511 RepID=UPI002548A150|nr:uncharacterized protein N7447_009530 [Penicillium robsamsonii]KAJ5817297.1 hypothetical protein N7447_009530 [Penicillium robsamsonii]